MSRKTIHYYRDLEAERRRAEAREINRLIGQLTQLSKLEKKRAKYEPDAAQDATNALQNLKSNRQALSNTERRQWLNRIEDMMSKLQQEIANAEAQRLRLEMTAAMLASRSDGSDRSKLNAISKSARTLAPSAFKDARSAIEAIITSRVTREASAPQSNPVSEESRALAKKLLGPEQEPAFVSTVANSDTAILDQIVSDLAILGAEADPLIERAKTLASDPNLQSLDLKFDSLRLDAAELRAKHLVKEEVERMKQEVETILSPYDDPAAAALRQQVTSLAPTDDEAARSILAETKEFATKRDQSADAQKARTAVVQGLQQLGYEVRIQGGQWNEGDRITVARPSEPNYDVQLMSPPGGKIQSKVRAYMHADRSETANTRDTEVETQWCEDLRTLNAELESQGLSASLIHEDEPGSGAPHFAEQSRDAPETARRPNQNKRSRS